MQATPVVRDIVLLGGGHAHVIVIKKWAMHPIPGVRMTLVSRDVLTPYSGMLPGLIAGHYTPEEIHIDLMRLCRWSDVRFIEAEIEGISAKNNRISLAHRPSLEYDVLSVDTGSTPNLMDIDGINQFTIPVKPVHQFFNHWQKLYKKIHNEKQAYAIGVVGAGAGGFEIMLSMLHKLQKLSPDTLHKFHWIVRGNEVLSGHSKKVKNLALACCKRNNISIHSNFSVTSITADTVYSRNNQSLSLNKVIWCTDAIGPQWLEGSGLDLDNKGFIAVNRHLQSISTKNIFAAGDIATQINNPRPKAGVFAVRAGSVLFDNLQRYLLNKSLKIFGPQRNFLSILATGDKSAIASYRRFGLSGRWVWRWKHHIDTGFMQQFKQLPVKTKMQSDDIPQSLLKDDHELFDPDVKHCAGCGAKIASQILTQVIGQLDIYHRNDQILGLDAGDDAAIINPQGHCLAQSVDQIRSMVDDHYIFGRIAANHALSDLFAMGAEPQSAMVLVSLAHATQSIQKRDLLQLMHGITSTLKQCNCTLSGGHSNESAETSLGLVVNGLLKPTTALLKSGLQSGNQLILTKPIGTGVLLAADMQASAKGPDLQACIRTMLLSNQQAASIFKQHDVNALTDVTGFGLIGHLLEMLRASNVGCNLQPTCIPMLTGALNLSKQGIGSTLLPKNLDFASSLKSKQKWETLENYQLLFDPQTSGGLLAGIPASKLDSCLKHLRRDGYADATHIGTVINRSEIPDAWIVLKK